MTEKNRIKQEQKEKRLKSGATFLGFVPKKEAIKTKYKRKGRRKEEEG